MHVFTSLKDSDICCIDAEIFASLPELIPFALDFFFIPANLSFISDFIVTKSTK